MQDSKIKKQSQKNSKNVTLLQKTKFTEYKEKIMSLLLKNNISLDVDFLLRDIEITDKSYVDVLDTFLLRYSEQYKVLTAIYNMEYPYDLEINKKLKAFKDVLYEVQGENFYGIKFNKPKSREILEYVIQNNVLFKGLMVDIKYDMEYFMNFLSKLKLDFDLKFLSDNISNVFVVLNQQSSSLINKIILYEIYKKLKNPKVITYSYILTKEFKISFLNNKVLERFYINFSVSDISYCIREYLDRNGFLIHFSTICVDCIAYILYIQNKRSPNYLRDFLKFCFRGYSLINCSKIATNLDNTILLSIDNIKYTVRYPSLDHINRLRFLNKEVYTNYFTQIGTSYFSSKNINAFLCFSNYKDYDLVLSNLPINGSKMITYNTEITSEIFSFTDKRAYLYYSKSSHTLMIKFKEELNRELFYSYLISSCKFKYILIN